MGYTNVVLFIIFLVLTATAEGVNLIDSHVADPGLIHTET